MERIDAHLCSKAYLKAFNEWLDIHYTIKQFRDDTGFKGRLGEFSTWLDSPWTHSKP